MVREPVVDKFNLKVSLVEDKEIPIRIESIKSKKKKVDITIKTIKIK